jgi:glycopeptide antibiotics resistance protein
MSAAPDLAERSATDGVVTVMGDAERWGRRLALLWTLAYAGLIVVVSLFPGHFDSDPLHIARQLHMLRRSFTISPGQLHSLRDLATNFILYVPLGVLLGWVLPGRRARALGLLAGLFLGFMLSACMESLQIYSNRYPDFWDLMTNGTGHLAGFLVIVRVRAQRGLTAAIFVGRSGGTSKERLAAGLRQAYVPLVGLLALLPFNITVAMSDVWAKLSGHLVAGGAIWLSPLRPWPSERLLGLPTALLLFVPYGFLSQIAHPERGKRAFVRYAGLAALISLGIELAQILVKARSTDLMQPLAAALGAVLGVALARAWDRASATDSGERVFSLKDGLSLAALAWIVVLMWQAWRPFTFVGSWKEAASRLIHETEWLPLHAYASGQRSLAIWQDLGREAGWYIPLGMLLQAMFSRMRWPHWLPPRIVVAGGICLAIGTVLELGQAGVIGRLADTTDIVSHCIGGGLGYLLLSALHRARKSGSQGR